MRYLSTKPADSKVQEPITTDITDIPAPVPKIQNYEQSVLVNPNSPGITPDIPIPVTDDPSGYPGVMYDPNVILGGEPVANYKKYMTDVFMTSKGKEGLDYTRATNQNIGEQLGHATVQLLGGIPLGVIENAGYLIDVAAQWNTITGEGDTYKNALTEWATKNRKALSDTMPIYKENPNAVFANDSGWWIEAGLGLLESIAEFGATGIGLGKLYGSGIKALGTSIVNTRALETGAQILTAAQLSYTEGAMSGARVYEQVLADGGTKEQAAEAAATTVRLNTVMNTGLNMTGIAPMFRAPSFYKTMSKQLARPAGMGRQEYIQLIKAMKSSAPNTPYMAVLAREGFLEAFEEMNNVTAENEGMYQGGLMTGTITGKEAETFIGRMFQSMGTEEALVSAALGFVGGVGNHGVLHLTGDEKADREQKEEMFLKHRDFIVEKLNSIAEVQNEVAKAAEEGDIKKYNKATADLFNMTAHDAIINGHQDIIIAEYEQIAAMTPEEAQAQGYATDPESDKYYKKLATKNIANIKTLGDIYNKIQKKYVGENQAVIASGYGEHLFGNRLQAHHLTEGITESQQELTKQREQLRKNMEARGLDWTAQEFYDKVQEIDGFDKAIEENNRLREELSGLDLRTKEAKAKVKRLIGTPTKVTRNGVNDTLAMRTYIENTLNNRELDLKRKKEKANDEVNAKIEAYKETNPEFEGYSEQVFLNDYKQLEMAETSLAETYGEIEAARTLLKELDGLYKEAITSEYKKEFVEGKTKERKDRVKEDKAAKEKAETDAKNEAANEEIERAKEAKRAEEEAQRAEEAKKKDEDTDDSNNKTSEEEVKSETEEEVAEDIANETNTDTRPTEDPEDASDIPFEEQLTTGDVDGVSTDGNGRVIFVGEKLVPAASAIAYKSREYDETLTPDTSEPNTLLSKKNSVGKPKYKGMFLPFESHTKYQPKTKLTLKIDINFDEEINGKRVTYKDIADSADTIPIAIFDDEGNKVGYLHTLEWITEHVVNTLPDGSEEVSFENVADVTGPVGARSSGNVEAQARIAMAIRDAIFEKGEGESFEVEIVSREAGKLYRTEVPGKISDRVPDWDTHGFAIVGDGVYLTSRGNAETTRKFITDPNKLPNSVPVVILPTPNGKFAAVPFYLPTLTEALGGKLLETVSKTVQAYLENDTEFLNQIRNFTGLDVSTHEGLKIFLNSITYVSNKPLNIFKDYVNNNTIKSLPSHINITKEGIYIAQHKSVPIKLTAATFNAAEFETFLGSKRMNIDIDKINKPGEIVFPILKDGELIENSYDSYNTFLANNSYTTVEGTYVEQTKEYTYFDQPVTTLDMPGLLNELNVDINKAIPTEPVGPIRDFNQALADKLQTKLQSLYPEIKLNITNNPIWEQGDNIFNQEEYNNQIQYRLKAVDTLLSDKAIQVFEKGKKNGWDLNKILTELQIPKEQKQIILNININRVNGLDFINQPQRGNNAYNISLNGKLIGDFDLLKDKDKWVIDNVGLNEEFKGKGLGKESFRIANSKIPKGEGTLHSSGYFEGEDAKNVWKSLVKSNEAEKIGEEEWKFKEQAKIYNEDNLREEIITSLLADNSFVVEINTAGNIDDRYNNDDNQIEPDFDEEGNMFIPEPKFKPTQYYSSLSAPGGTKGKSKYEGNPDWEYQELEISTPAITPNIKGHAQFSTDNGIGWARVWYNKKTGVVEVQEVQSDLFQKGRDKRDLTTYDSSLDATLYRENFDSIEEMKEYEKNAGQNNNNAKDNQFLQLLNKDSNWVTFFVKSIIQNTAKQTITEVQQEDVEAKVRELEKEGLLEIDCKGKLKAEKGLATSFTKGGKWKVIKDLKGYPTHKEGGVDLTISKNGVSIKNGNTQFTAKHGLVISAIKAQDGLVVDNNPEYEAMSKVLSQRNKHLNWVERGLSPDNYPKIDNKDGSFSTHKLAYGTGDKGEAYIYPTIIQNDNGELEQLDDEAAWEYAKKTKTAMVVPNVELAKYYSQNGLIKH
jgi:hypothetical protein